MRQERRHLREGEDEHEVDEELERRDASFSLLEPIVLNQSSGDVSVARAAGRRAQVRKRQRVAPPGWVVASAVAERGAMR